MGPGGFLFLPIQTLPTSRKFGNLESNTLQKMKIIQSKIRSVQNVGKVWISRTWNLLTLFQAMSGIFPWAGKKLKKTYKRTRKHIFSESGITGDWQQASEGARNIFCYFTGLGPLLLSTLGGGVCICAILWFAIGQHLAAHGIIQFHCKPIWGPIDQARQWYQHMIPNRGH